MSGEDQKDYHLLHRLILVQAIDDYVKLMHPKRRRKKHLSLAWVSAAALLFDTDYTMEFLVSPEKQKMVLMDLVMAGTERENVDLEALRTHVLKQADNYWQEHSVQTVEIPKNVVVENHPYQVMVSPTCSNHTIDYEEMIITLSALGTEEHFCRALAEAAAYHLDTKVSKRALDDLGSAWFRILRANNCFVGD